MARSEAPVSILVGTPGVGKSYRMCRELVKEHIPHLCKGAKIYTNLPLNIDAFVKKFDESVRDKIVLIPEEEEKKWIAGSKENEINEVYGIWNYFATIPANSIIILDEIHELVNPKSTKACKENWGKFIGTIRHKKINFIEFLTQAEDNIINEIKSRATIKVTLEDASSFTDPIFKIPNSDWYNLKASFTGHFHKKYIETRVSRKGNRWGRAFHTEGVYLTEAYFSYYNSYNEKDLDGSTIEDDDAGGYKRPYEQMNTFRLVMWFIKRNLISLSYRLSIFFLFVWLLFFGGAMNILNYIKEDFNAFNIKQNENKNKTTKTTKTTNDINENKNISVEQKTSVKNRIEEETQKKPIKKAPRIVLIAEDFFIDENNKVYRKLDLFNDEPVFFIKHKERSIYTNANIYTIDD